MNDVPKNWMTGAGKGVILSTGRIIDADIYVHVRAREGSDWEPAAIELQNERDRDRGNASLHAARAQMRMREIDLLLAEQEDMRRRLDDLAKWIVWQKSTVEDCDRIIAERTDQEKRVTYYRRKREYEHRLMASFQREQTALTRALELLRERTDLIFRSPL